MERMPSQEVLKEDPRADGSVGYETARHDSGRGRVGFVEQIRQWLEFTEHSTTLSHSELCSMA